VSQGIDSYCKTYSLNGSTCLDPNLDAAHIAANGALASVATLPGRLAFVQAVWDLVPPEGAIRYYPGILHLVSLLILSGQFRVY
jgi:oligosaccharide reducing-end xylanase